MHRGGLTIEQTTLGEVRKLVYTPSRPIILLETIPETFEPLVHSLFVTSGFLCRDYILHYCVLSVSSIPQIRKKMTYTLGVEVRDSLGPRLDVITS
jgi:hypothetical protein